MTQRLFLTTVCVLVAFSASAADRVLHTFTKLHLDPHFWSEGANVGDFNKDGTLDVVAGPYWYAGPDFKKRHEYYPAKVSFEIKAKDGKSSVTIPGFAGALSGRNQYSDNFFAFSHDFNKDGWDDILILGFPGKDASWYENSKGKAGHWKRHVVFDVVDNESPTFGDITGDGVPEIICNSGGYFGYVSVNWKQPTAKWTFHRISPKGKWQRFTHGLGYGDVNGDGRTDLIDKTGWWEQPASLEGDPEWKNHKVFFSANGAQMYAYDVNGDGLNDIITSLSAHGWGLAWHEQIRKDGKITFKQHTVMNEKPSENRYGVKFSQLHAIDLVDMDGDGLKDIVTGKRYWAHGPKGDAEPNTAAVLYWFKLTRKGGKVDFLPYLIDDDSGIGTQVVARDINGDKLPDIIVGNKKGAFVHIHSTKKVSEAEWKAAQPKLYVAAKTVAVKPAATKPATPGEVAFAKPTGSEGTLPKGKDGKPLNLDFETGTLKDWTTGGRAFEQQPMLGGIDPKRPFGADKNEERQGRYWVGGYEILRDRPKGTLESVAFKVDQPWATFRVGGGNHPGTRVELVSKATGKAFFTARGRNRENMLLAVVDLRKQVGKEISVRIVDEHTGGWGHVNFDDFRFHAAKPSVRSAAAIGAGPSGPALPPLDTVKFAGLTADKAAAEMTLPEGFKATAFAAEPDVKQPIAFAMDDRGRLWVAEAYAYPFRKPEGEGKDRILILEDTDGDGVHDKRTIFAENLNLVSGIEVGFGGVWVGAAPYLMFIPDKDGDDKPDSKPQILLDGWGYQDTHEMLNTFAWGPDGWLYGCHGVFTHSKVGKPGTSDEERTKINAGIWRYHPLRHEFEVFAEGTSNPWGLDFNQYGHAFIEACVIPHFFHIIQGARYQRQAGKHFNPHTYDDIKTIADHLHYLGARPHAGNARSDAVGGGHAHAGLMVYLGGSWPKKYHGQAFMNNIHGQRLNVDSPVRKGSGYVGKHSPDFLNFNDKASQVLNMIYDQNGSMYMVDWYDLNQCHRRDDKVHDRSNGRIYKVVYNNEKWTPVDLQKANDGQLVEYQFHKNEWYARHARRILQERGPNPQVKAAVLGQLIGTKDPVHRLRLLWTLHVTGGLSERTLLGALKDRSEYVRAWAVQLACESVAPSDALLKAFADMAANDASPHVRLYLASAMQRTPVAKRIPVLQALAAHADDADDHNLALMYWYAAEPVVGESPANAVKLLTKTKIPRIREYITRRMTAAKKVAAGE